MRRILAFSRKVNWTERLVRLEKASIKAELDGIEAEKGSDARLQYALLQGHALAESEDPRAQLRRLIYVISALAHHERRGGLTRTHIGHLTEVAYAILQVHGVQPVTSKLAFLFSDLHLILSQIHRRSGAPWKAAWEQQMALHLARRTPAGGPGLQALAAGIRALRLGHAELALGQFQKASDDPDVEAGTRLQARLNSLKALRLLGRPAEAETLDAALSAESLDPRFAREVAWEEFCRRASLSGDLRPMIAAVKKGRPHHLATYICEAYLWAGASQQTSWRDRLPSLRTLAKTKVVQARRSGYVYKCIAQLDACYDASLPHAVRLRQLGEILDGLGRLVSVDQELLMWLAAARWLARTGALALSTLAWKEYAALSIRLTSGAASDALALAADLDERQRREEPA